MVSVTVSQLKMATSGANAPPGGSVVYSRPYDELPLKTDKYAQACVTLHLGGKGITHSQGFEKFLNLNSLFLHENRLTGIEGLEENFRIKQLYLHNNRIRVLQPGCFSSFSFLNVLTLNGNLIDDLEGTIQEIKSLGHLKSVDLFDNPIAQEDNYRKRVVCELSESCEVLDRHVITADERKEAAAFKIKMAKLQKISSSRRQVKLPPSEEEEAAARRAKQRLEDVLASIQKFIKDNRPMIEECWLKYDKRELGIVTPDQFWEVLRQFGIEQLLSQEEREMVQAHYMTKAVVPALSATHTLTHSRVNYFRFCRDVVPPLLQLHKAKWTMDKAPEVSVTAKDLHTYIATVHRQTIERDQEIRRQQLEASRALIAESNTNVFGDRVTGMEHKCVKHGLDPWTSGELSRIIASFETDTNPTECTLTLSQVQAIFRKMMRFKLIPEQGISRAVDKLFNADSESLNVPHGRSEALTDDTTKPISAIQFRAIAGCSTTSPKCFTSSSSTTSSSAANAKGATTKGGAKNPPSKSETAQNRATRPEVLPAWTLRWRPLTEEEEIKLTHKVGDNAAALLDKLLRLGAKDDPTQLIKDTLAASVDLSRMNKNNTAFTNKASSSASSAVVIGDNKLSRTGGVITLAPANKHGRTDIMSFPNLSKPVLPTIVTSCNHQKRNKHRREHK
jgi:hypothetical protein